MAPRPPRQRAFGVAATALAVADVAPGVDMPIAAIDHGLVASAVRLETQNRCLGTRIKVRSLVFYYEP